MKERIPVIIDTDLGDDIDDAFALCLAMQSPELEILGVTTVHRCAAYRAKMAKSLLNAGGFCEVPVYAGESKPLVRESVHGRPLDYGEKPHSYAEEYDATEYDGDDAVSFIVGTLEKSDRKITLVTLGALTNIALVLQKRPDLFGKIEKLCIMGGAFSMNLGEYNFSLRSRRRRDRDGQRSAHTLRGGGHHLSVQTERRTFKRGADAPAPLPANAQPYAQKVGGRTYICTIRSRSRARSTNRSLRSAPWSARSSGRRNSPTVTS